MPGITGIEVLKQLKSIAPEARVIIASADIQHLTKELVKQEGADGFINKPIVEEEVLTMVNSFAKKG